MRCPVCKADNPTGPQCRRCKADLTLLFTLEDQREHELATARFHLAHGHGADARPHVEAAARTREDEGTRRLTAVARLLAGDYRGALAMYRAGHEDMAR